MPYIPKERRKALWSDSTTDYDNDMKTSGELNFMITELLKEYIKTHKLSYQTINDITGALTNARAEFYRRIAVPYEQQKRKENGDVY